MKIKISSHHEFCVPGMHGITVVLDSVDIFVVVVSAIPNWLNQSSVGIVTLALMNGASDGSSAPLPLRCSRISPVGSISAESFCRYNNDMHVNHASISADLVNKYC